MVKKYPLRYRFYLFLFTLVFGVVLYDFINDQIHFSYIDELIASFLLIEWILLGKKRKETVICFLILLGYLIYAIVFPNNVQKAIVMDFIIQAKPYIAFFAVYDLYYAFNPRESNALAKTCLLLSLCLVPVGILGVGGGPIMNSLCGGHARFATACTALSLTYLCFSRSNRKNVVSLFLLLVGFASLRSKFFGFLVSFVFIIFFWKNVSVKHVFSKKTMILFILVLIVGLYFSWSKIDFYFIEGFNSGYNDDKMFARPYMYLKGFEILKDNPLLGTGFGSYGTFASAMYYSPIYFQYKMVYNVQIGNGLFICDAFYPSLVEFGLIGIFLYIIFWKNRISTCITNYKSYENVLNLKIGLLIAIFFLIEGIADTTFTHNRGMYMLMLLAVVLREKSVFEKNIGFDK